MTVAAGGNAPSVAVPQEVLDAIRRGDVMVCWTKCEPCQWGQHEEPARWHGWAGPEDLEHYAATGQPDPSGSRCGCPCADGPVRDDAESEPPDVGLVSLDAEPCPECGEAGACAYDDEGRPLIHALTAPTDEDTS